MTELTRFFGIIVFMCAELGASHHKGIEVGHRGFVAAIENLWDKYAVTLKDILAERDGGRRR